MTTKTETTGMSALQIAKDVLDGLEEGDKTQPCYGLPKWKMKILVIGVVKLNEELKSLREWQANAIKQHEKTLGFYRDSEAKRRKQREELKAMNKDKSIIYGDVDILDDEFKDGSIALSVYRRLEKELEAANKTIEVSKDILKKKDVAIREAADMLRVLKPFPKRDEWLEKWSKE